MRKRSNVSLKKVKRPAALIHFYALLSQEYSHSQQPALNIGYSGLASQDKIFQGVFGARGRLSLVASFLSLRILDMTMTRP